MNRSTRTGVILAGVIALVVLFVAVRPSDPDEPAAERAAVTQQAPAAASTGASTTTTPTITETSPTATEVTPAPPPEPKAPLLTRGKVEDIEVEKGETVRLRAKSSVAEELHVHDYDRSKAMPAGKTVNLSFPAELEGIFEIEFENSGIEVAKLTVEP